MKCVSAKFHQGSDIFSENSRGRICVANSLVCIALNAVNQKLLGDWDSNDIHYVLEKGDMLYQYARQGCPHEYLNPEELPKNICILDELFHVSALPVYSVEIRTSFKDNGPFRSLATALNLCFSNTKDGGIFICNGTSVAVFSSDSEFHVFSPHARDSNVNINADGNSVLWTVSGFSDLQALLRKLFVSAESAAFELYTISIANVEKMTFAKDMSIKKLKINVV